jgi:type IV pilus assembly protein PilQ
MKSNKNYLRILSGATLMVFSFQSWAIASNNVKDKNHQAKLIAQAFSNNNNQEVLVPNPTIRIDGKPVQPTQPTPPPFLPRAVAPPVGDMAISNVDSSFKIVDLGASGKREIPRVSLENASARATLKELARLLGYGFVFNYDSDATISLETYNTSIEDNFNYILMITGLNASRKGNTIFVGDDLPFAARNMVTRSIRMNQYPIVGAAEFLGSQGASVKIVDVEEAEGEEAKIQFTTKEVFLEEAEGERLILRGLTVHGDEINNNIVLVGPPHLVQIASSFLTQLDVRRRQVAVNVKVVDVQLDSQYSFGSSFSFGVDNTGVVQDGGVGVINFGTNNQNVDPLDYRVDEDGNLIPAFEDEIIISEDFSRDLTETLESSIERNLERTIDENTARIISEDLGQTFSDTINRTLNQFGNTTSFSRSQAEALTQALQQNLLNSAVTTLTDEQINDLTEDIQDEVSNIVTRTVTRTLQGDPLGYPNSGRISPFGTTADPNQPGQLGSVTPGSNFNVPQAFLAQIRANIDSGNAKILTDPTLVVQEGQVGTVELIENVVTSVNTSIDQLSGVRTVTPVIEPAGLTLSVAIQKIDDNGYVSLITNPSVSAPGTPQVFNSGLGAQNIITPLIERNVSSGLVRLRDGQSLILSGIISDGERTVTSKVPVLGDLPIIGSLFRSTVSQRARTEVIVLLTPQIINDSEAYSGFGYNYTPTRETGKYLRERGLTVPTQP